MKVLLVEDNPDTRWSLEVLLLHWNYEPMSVGDGVAAWDILSAEGAPKLVLLDMSLPKLDGLSICRLVQQRQSLTPPYIICVTGNASKDQIAIALKAGADDYITKPYDSQELEARLWVGQRIVLLQEKAVQLKQLQRLLPICAWCKKVRNDQEYWQELEEYLGKQLDLTVTHGICPACSKKVTATQRQLEPGNTSAS